MNMLNDFLANGLAQSMPIIGNDKALVYDGESYQGVFNEKTHGSELDFGGVVNDYDATFLIPNTEIVANGAITKDKKCTLDGRTWKIKTVIDGTVTTTLILGDPNASRSQL